MVLPLVPASTTTTPTPEASAGTHLLIAHMRYMGKREDFDKDMSKVGEDPETQRWWKVSYGAVSLFDSKRADALWRVRYIVM